MRVLLLLFVICFHNPTQAQNWEWAKRIGGTSAETLSSVHLTSNNELLVGGSYRELLTLGSFEFNALAESDCFLSKHDANGTVLWAISAGSPNSDASVDVETDGVGNVYWLGQYWLNIIFENDTLQSGPNSKAYFLAKFDNNGNYLWSKSINGTEEKVVSDLAIDSENNLILSGYFADTLLVDQLSLHASATESAFLIKLDTSGNIIWGSSYGESGNIIARRVEILSGNQIVLAGHMQGEVSFDSNTLTSGLTSLDLFVTTFTSDGQAIWSKLFPGVFDDKLNALTVTDDAILLSGNFIGVLSIDGFELSTPGFNDNLFLIKLDGDGDAQWARTVSSQDEDQLNFSLDLTLRNDLILMTGFFKNTLIIDDLSINAGDLFQGFVVGFDYESGQIVKLGLIQGSGTTISSQIQIDDQGQFYLGGTFDAQVNFGDSQLSSTGSTDIFIAKATPSFTPVTNFSTNDSKVLLFPNPVSDFLNIKTNANFYLVKIYNTQGQLLTVLENPEQINFVMYPKGNYFLSFDTAEGQTISIHSIIKL